MTNFVLTHIRNHVGFITLNRPKALNSLSLEMIRLITQTLQDWKSVDDVQAIVIHSNHERAFCAGGDVRFFYEKGSSNTALLEDFFTEEYMLNYLIHHYPKPYISLLDGVVMGGGMGIGQGGKTNRLRIVTERTKMAMPEVNIGFFPDVGGSYFLSRCAGEIGTYLGVTGETVDASDAIYADLADLYLPGEHIPELINYIEQTNESDLRLAIKNFAAPYQTQLPSSKLMQHRSTIDQHFSYNDVTTICAALNTDPAPFAKHTLQVMQSRSPLMMCVTLEQLRRGKNLSLAACLRMERTMVRHCFEHGEVLEGVRALVIDKDAQPKWQPANLSEVSPEMINQFFEPTWPDYAHPLRDLD
jgi:enoyl-CoA hydratase/carnithine racemase